MKSVGQKKSRWLSGAGHWFRRSIAWPVLVIVTAVFFHPGSAGARPKPGDSATTPSGSFGKALPVKKPGSDLRPWEVAGLDLLVPGFGMAHHQRYYWAAGYAAAKLGALYFTYVAWKNYQFALSWERAARRRQSNEDFPLKFIDPRDGQNALTYQEIRRRVGPAGLTLVYSVVANIVVYSVSALHSYSLSREDWQQAVPTFRLSHNSAALSWEHRF